MEHLDYKTGSHHYRLGASDLHIWLIRTPSKALPEDLSPLAACLSVQEQDRYHRLRRPDIRQNFLLSRGCLRYVVSLYLNCPAGAPEFSLGRYGKPELKADGPALQFNLSHSQGIIAIALHRHRPVGIDIERMRPVTHLEKLCQRCLTHQESKTVLGLGVQAATRRFLRYWTAKEAILKATGLGLSYPLKHVEVFLEAENLTGQPVNTSATLLPHDEFAPDPSHYLLYQWQPEADCIAAVAIPNGGDDDPPLLNLHQTTAQELLRELA